MPRVMSMGEAEDGFKADLCCVGHAWRAKHETFSLPHAATHAGRPDDQLMTRGHERR